MAKTKKKTVMESFFLDEISGVDKPAQEGARVLLMKRDDGEEDLLKAEGLMLTSDEKGHSHLLNAAEDGGTTSNNTSSGAEFGHSHPWIKKTDGSVMIGAAEGHSHDVLEKRYEPEDVLGYEKREFSREQRDRLAREGKALPDGSYPIATVADLENAIQAFGRAKNKGRVAEHIKRRARALGATDRLPEEGMLALKSVTGEMQKEQETMAEKKIEKTVETVEQQLQDVQDQLAVAKAFGELTDAEKAHYKGLGDAEKAAFLKLDIDGRKAELAKVADSDPVVYKDAAGNEYRKSDDPRVVSNAKRADEAERIAKAEREKRETAELSKRAEDELGNLPGDAGVKVALLKAVDGITDEKIRDGVTALLKAGNDERNKAFEKAGVRGAGEESDSEVELEKLAEEYAKDKQVSIEVARAEVLEKTEKGRELAKRMDDEFRARGK